MAPTKQAEVIFTERGFRNVSYIGHGLGDAINIDDLSQEHVKHGTHSMRLLHVAGHNPSTRKQTARILEAFAVARKFRSDIELIVTTSKPVDEFWNHPIPEGVEIKSGFLSRAEITDLYQQSDLSIQVSSHEGIGLGFYESVAAGVPVLSLNAKPHNEVIVEGQTGFLLPCESIALPDNSNGLVGAYRFEVDDLANSLIRISREDITRTTLALVKFHEKHLSRRAFQIRLLRNMTYGHQSDIELFENKNKHILRFVLFLTLKFLWKVFVGSIQIVYKIEFSLTKRSLLSTHLLRVKGILVANFGHLKNQEFEVQYSIDPTLLTAIRKFVFKLAKPPKD